jgi:NADPH-dependent 2,4-dienoyl-CoA reductase/sulfur reductase-like enzyme
LPPIDTKNVYFIRSNQDQANIKKQIDTAESIVVVGGGFIGSESAASIAYKYG